MPKVLSKGIKMIYV